MKFKALVLMLIFASPLAALANGEDTVAVLKKRAIYLPLKPSFVVNYGGGGRLKYLKADVTVRLSSPAAANAVRHHLPYIRNNLVLLFASQTDDSINSQEGKEALRAEALRQIREIIEEEDGLDGIVDLYFNRLIVQQ